jgi:hypothetical protein
MSQLSYQLELRGKGIKISNGCILIDFQCIFKLGL